MMEVLQSKAQIKASRKAMEEQGRSVLEGRLANIMRRIGFSRGLRVGDLVKSWDVHAHLTSSTHISLRMHAYSIWEHIVQRCQSRSRKWGSQVCMGLISIKSDSDALRRSCAVQRK
jgi:hypothetical protein